MVNTAPTLDAVAANVPPEHPELVFNKFIQYLIGPNKKSSFVFNSPQLAAISDQEKRMMALFESCPTKCVMSGIGGMGMGMVLGLFTASVDPMYTINPNRVPTMREIAVEMKTRALSTGKNFAIIGIIFSAIECNIESYRGKTDLYNGFLGGFFTGGLLGLRAGLKAGIWGGAGFALFSVAIESVLMNRH